jgi:hypothetical protein
VELINVQLKLLFVVNMHLHSDVFTSKDEQVN